MARIEPIEPQNATPTVGALYDQLRKDLNIEPNNFFKTMGHSPVLLKPLIDFSFAMLENGRLERRLKEWVILQIGRLNDCPYVYEAHKHALSRVIMRDVLDDRPQALDMSSLSDDEKLAIRYAHQVTANTVDDATFEELRTRFDQEQIVELTVLASYYNFICRAVNALDVQTDVMTFLEPQEAR